MEKLFHPSIHEVMYDGTEPEMLDMCAMFLHELGWMTQQGSFDEAASILRFYAEQQPEVFLMACATGFAAIRRLIV